MSRKSDAEPREIASAVNLMAHPAASAMVLSAIGFGMANHAFGIWVQAVSAATEASHRFWQPFAAAQWPKSETVAAPAVSPSPRDNVVSMSKRAEQIAKLAFEVAPAAKAAAVPKPAEPVKDDALVATAVTEAAPAGPRAPASIARPDRPDDLKAISGVGPKLEQVLNGLGVWTYAQIAAWGAEETAWVDQTLGFRGRIDRDGWVAQSAVLAPDAKIVS